MTVFKASTLLCFGVTLSDGNRVRVVFTPLTGGDTIFYTDDNELAEALERHPYFGDLFEKDEAPGEESVAESVESANESKSSGNDSSLSFAHEEDAKEYIANKYGVSRTRLKTRSSIEKVAGELGVTIEWEGKPSETIGDSEGTEATEG
nr:MAG TPA: hypothetical protein [Caudoviricetes sp.]